MTGTDEFRPKSCSSHIGIHTKYIVENTGLYIPVCAIKHNARPSALEKIQDVVIYYGLGPGPVGSVQGMLYLMDDAFIIGVGQPSSSGITKAEQLILQ